MRKTRTEKSIAKHAWLWISSVNSLWLCTVNTNYSVMRGAP